MTSVNDVTSALDRLAPPSLAYDWDNVGLQVGDPSARVTKIMVALTLTQEVAQEAIRAGVDMIVTHHPLLFRPLKSIRWDQPSGRLLKEIVESEINVYTLHTNLDTAPNGLNDWLAESFSLADIRPLCAPDGDSNVQEGRLGRIGRLVPDTTLEEFCHLVKRVLAVSSVKVMGELGRPVRTVAVCGGDGGKAILPYAVSESADVLLTGDVRYHLALEAASYGISVVDAGHFGTERVAVMRVADFLARNFAGRISDVVVAVESDPFKYI